jgi:hypothetical protein
MPKCGARFRKPVSQISDRAKRYRAHTPECRPLGPKRCFKCGSRQNVVPDHKDGNESNGKRSNLRWACKSHNTILGKAMAKAGKGVRTRQYNPKRRNPGARSLGEYVSAAVSHTRGAHDEAGLLIHQTPKAKRREFAAEIWDRRGRNPERTEAKKLSHAAVKFESPSRHSSQTCASCVHFIAASPNRCEAVKSPIKAGDWCKRFSKSSGSAADKLYRKFHGRGPDRIRTLLVLEVDPYGSHPELAQLGFLIRFIVGEGVVLGGEYGDEVKEAEWVNEISFVPSVTRWHNWLENSDVTVQEAKAYLKSVRVPDIASEPNARQLYVVDGNQYIDESRLIELGADPDKDIADLGFCYLIEYFTQKRFDKFEPTNYWHHFGERTGVQPRLLYHRAQKRLSLAGGEYIVKPAGIDN